jgi:hypothetical protein
LFIFHSTVESWDMDNIYSHRRRQTSAMGTITISFDASSRSALSVGYYATRDIIHSSKTLIISRHGK